MRFIRSVKLEQFCLHVIVENLEKLIYSHSVPPKHIDFLLRVYSEEVFRKYSHNQSISEDCMLWFLNPHSKKITLRIVTEKITKQLQIVGSNITSLSLSQSLASERMINSILCCVPHVTYLDLSGSQCSDGTLLCVHKMCHAVVTLNLYDCINVTNKGMENLCGKNFILRNLNLNGTSVQQHGISIVLQNIPLLQCLRYPNFTETLYHIHENDFIGNSSPSVHYNLTELIYEDIKLYLDPIKVLQAWTVLCPNVTKIHLSFGVTEEVLEMCTKFQNLEELKISFLFPEIYSGGTFFFLFTHVQCRLTQSLFIMLGKRLTTLNLCYVDIPTVILMEFPENLKNLCLQNVTFTEHEGDDIPLKENKLEVLAVRSLSMNIPSTYKAILFLLSVSKNVTELYLTGIQYMPQDVADIVLKTMENLQFVDFSYSTVYFSSFVRFFEIPSMTTLCLECLNISPLIDNADFERLVTRSLTTTISWCQWEDCSDESDDESCENYSFSNLY